MVDDQEFQRWMNILWEQGKATNERLDVLNGRVRENEKDIAVLQDRQPENPRRGLSISSMVLAAGTALGELLHWYSAR